MKKRPVPKSGVPLASWLKDPLMQKGGRPLLNKVPKLRKIKTTHKGR